jgi:hypothetical protein
MATSIAPMKTPHDFGMTANDTHLIVNDISEKAKAFDFSGKLLWEVPALARGQYSDLEYGINHSDTPPGLYKLGTVYKDYLDPDRTSMADLLAYGWITFELIDLEGLATRLGRLGLCMHGGGTGDGWPGAWAEHQYLLATLGCVRMYNSDLVDRVLPLYELGTVFVSVIQEA